MYVKLFTQILDSSIADNRPLRHFFTDLLLCADSKGYVMMTENALARRIGATLEEVQWGLRELQKPDPISKNPASEGTRIERVEGSGYGWRIVNYEHYRAMKDADQLREATRDRVRKHRERKAAVEKKLPGNKSSVTVTKGIGGNANTEAEAEADADRKQDKPVSSRERPTRMVFDEYVIKHLGMTQNDADHVWNVYEENGWTRAQAGKRIPISNWKLALNTWKTGFHFPSQKAHANDPHQRSSTGGSPAGRRQPTDRNAGGGNAQPASDYSGVGKGGSGDVPDPF